MVWQSITGLYWPEAETRRVHDAVAGAAAAMPLAHVCMEYDEEHAVGAVVTVGWSSGDGADMATERLGTIGDHGFPLRLHA